MKAKYRRGLLGKVLPGWCPFCGPTLFDERGPWLRDEYFCARCLCLPRHRALMHALERRAPQWRDLTVFESSPAGPVSDKISAECRSYQAGDYLEGVPSGQVVDGIRSEDLRSLSFEDDSFDLVISSDVLEHVVDPAPAFREIARVLRPGGAHIFTVPIFSGPETVVRIGDDGVELMPPDYHGDPDGGRAFIVVREWGRDIVDFIDAAGGTRTELWSTQSRWRGIRGEMTDVLITRKPPRAG